jgi:hypothetical protein
MSVMGLDFQGAYFNADKAFDTKDARKTCFNHGVVPNIDENKRNRKGPKRGRSCLVGPFRPVETVAYQADALEMDSLQVTQLAFFDHSPRGKIFGDYIICKDQIEENCHHAETL